MTDTPSLPANDSPSSVQTRFGTRPVVFCLLLILAMCGGAIARWNWLFPDADRLLEQALAIRDTLPGDSQVLLDRAIEIRDGDFPDAQVASCELLARQRAWDEAQAEFNSVELAEVHSDLLLSFGELAVAERHYTLAITALKEVWERNTVESVAALRLLVNVYQVMGRQEDLLGILREATRRDPRDFEHWGVLILLLKAMFEETECLEATRAALQNDPPPHVEQELRYMLIQQLVVLGDSAHAWQEIHAQQEAGNDTFRLRAQTVDLYRLDGQLEAALDVATDIFPQVQQLPSAYLARGAIYFDLQEYAKAAEDFEQLVAMQPFNERAQFKLSEAYRMLGEFERALEHRNLGEQIRTARIQLNELRQQYEESPSAELRAEMASLYDELGEPATAEFWRQHPDEP